MSKVVEPSSMRFEAPVAFRKLSRKGENGEERYRFVIATQRVALDDGVVLMDGVDLERFMANPIVKLDHWDRFGRCVEIERVGDTLEGVMEIAPEDALSEGAAKAAKFMRWCGFGAASIGFVPTVRDSRPSAEEIESYGLDPKRGWIARKWQLLEWSYVDIGSDPGASMKKGATRADMFARAATIRADMGPMDDETDSIPDDAEDAPKEPEKGDDDEKTPAWAKAIADGINAVAGKLDALATESAAIAGKVAEILSIIGDEGEPSKEPDTASGETDEPDDEPSPEDEKGRNIAASLAALTASAAKLNEISRRQKNA
jgi:hypothetical protein